MNLPTSMPDREAVSRRVHTPVQAGSTPAPATPSSQAIQRAPGNLIPALRGPGRPAAGVCAVSCSANNSGLSLCSWFVTFPGLGFRAGAF